MCVHTGFPTGVENVSLGALQVSIGGGSSKFDRGGLRQYMGGACGARLKMLSNNTCEGIHLMVKLPAIGLQACKCTKNELLHRCF